MGVHDELDSHRLTAHEKAVHQERILNYDHIPASAALSASVTGIGYTYNQAIDAANQELQQLKQLGYPTHAHQTRHAENLLTPEAKYYNDRCHQLAVNINRFIHERKQECVEYAYTVAIPRKLHKQGETDQLSSNEQLARQGNVFLDDITTHLENFEKIAPEYGLVYLDNLIKAIGAFRLLYRTEMKSHDSPLPQQLSLGRFASAFFQKESDRAAIDALLMKEAMQFVRKC